MSPTPRRQPDTLGRIQTDAAGRKHWPELDALRGVAALVVVLNHFQAVWVGTTHPAWVARPRLNPLLWLLVNGHASVILFFLLSGFVLTLPSTRGAAQPYPLFALRRVCRIYLPYLCGLAVAVLGCTFFWGRTVFGTAVSGLWALPPDVPSVLQNVAMLPRFDVFRYDGPAWSLVHEMRISLIFPIILLCAVRLRAWAAFAVAAACGVLASLSLLYLENSLQGGAKLTSWSLTLSYAGIFLLGAALARRHARCADLLDRMRVPAKTFLLLVAVALYAYPPPGWHGIDAGDFCVACGGLVLLTFCLRTHGTFAMWLRLPAMQFLGRISYSLYLLHFPILLVLAYLSYGHIALPWLLLPFLTLSLGAAALMYRVVEQPSIALGRRLTRQH